jgi:hypothetical protein
MGEKLGKTKNEVEEYVQAVKRNGCNKLQSLTQERWRRRSHIVLILSTEQVGSAVALVTPITRLESRPGYELS